MTQPTNELEQSIKGTVLRPLANKFQELVRQIDSGEYELPKTIEEVETITESYINQAWSRIEQLISAHDKEIDRQARIDKCVKVSNKKLQNYKKYCS